MKTLAARVDAEWRAFTPLHEHTVARAREIAWGDGGASAGAVVGVYGSGKSTLLLTLLREAPAHGTVTVWEEAAPLLERLLGDDERVLPQTFAERVIAFLGAVVGGHDAVARARYLEGLRARGQGEIADVVEAQLESAGGEGHGAPARVLLLLDEVEQAHAILRRRVAVDDGQPLRALIDGTGPAFRLLLAYAPESFHSVGDADRGRLAYLPVPALDVSAIRECFGLSRGHASFVWWISRGRARGAIAAVRTVIEPLRRGAFDGGLDDLGDALAALPGVFGVPAIVREGRTHRELRALVDLAPQAEVGQERGIVCASHDREALADALFSELSRRVATTHDLGPVANELVAVIAAVADEDDRAYLTMDDFRAALRMAEARALESGRQREPIERFADQALLAFPALGEMTTLPKRLPLPLATLAEEVFPSPFTDPYLPLSEGARVPTEAELARALRDVDGRDGPLFRSEEGAFSVFSNDAALASWLERGGLDGSADPVRAVLLVPSARSAIVEMAHAAGRLRVVEVGPFHGTFLACLSLRNTATDGRQLARKIRWHLDRLALLLAEARPQASASFVAARRFVRDDRRRSVLARLKVDSPALLALLLPISPPRPTERRYLQRLAKLLDAREGIRKVARLVNPGGRLSGAAVVVDELLGTLDRTRGAPEEAPEGARELGDLLAVFGQDATLRARLSCWLLPEDAERLACLFAFAAGELPDISREHDQLGALSQLERTRRRVETIVDHLAICTGRPEEIARALRLGIVTEQARASGGPIDGLATLTTEIEAAPESEVRPWVRTLTLWVCGVFADRLLTGVEKEQADLAAWEQLAATTRDVGARASALASAFRSLGARTCEDWVTNTRRRVGTHLSSRDGLESSVRALRDLCALLEPVVASLTLFLAALREREITPHEAIASFLPDEDTASVQHVLFRRSAELLDEIEGPCPPPQGRGLVEYADLLRRHAEGSRHERLRLRLEAAIGVDVPRELRLDEETVVSIEQAWASLPPEVQGDVRGELALSPLPSAEDLERLLAQTDRKLALLTGWRATPTTACVDMLAVFDRRASAHARRPPISLQEVQRMDGDRRRVLVLLESLPAFVGPAATSKLLGEIAALEGGGIFGALCAALEAFSAELGALLEKLVRVGAAVPTEPLADAPNDLLRALRERGEAARSERDEALATARAVGLALASWGERAATIAAELDAPQAGRLRAREQERLRVVLEAEARDLGAALADVGLGPALVPEPSRDDLLAWSEALGATRRSWTELAACLSEIAAIEGRPIRAPFSNRRVTSWQQARDLAQAGLSRAEAEQRRLAGRLESAVARAHRLGAPAAVSSSHVPADGTAPPTDTTLVLLRERVERAEADVERLRAVRLREVSHAARNAYAAIRGHDARALPPAVGALVSLGLVVAIEDAS